MTNKDSQLIWEAISDRPEDHPTQRSRDYVDRATSETLRELEPAELLEFINEALPKFLQTAFNPEDYDEIRSKLYSAADLLNDPYGPGGQEHDAQVSSSTTGRGHLVTPEIMARYNIDPGVDMDKVAKFLNL